MGSESEARIIRLVRRDDGQEGVMFDVTGMSPRELDRLWDGLVYKVDFEIWCPEYEPPRGDDQTLAEWVTR